MQKSLDGDFIGGIQDSGEAAASSQGVQSEAQGGKTPEIRTFESQLPHGGEIKAARRRGDPFWVRQAMRDGDFHVRSGEPRRHRAVGKSDETVNNRLGVDQHVEPRGLDSKEIMRLDHLEPFVHEFRPNRW